MSLADKLNYTIAAKLDVQQACIYQGVDLPDNAPFGDYGKYIRLLSGGKAQNLKAIEGTTTQQGFFNIETEVENA